MNDELRDAIQQAIQEATNADELLHAQAAAAAEAVVRLGFMQSAGWEYALRREDVLLGQSFNTREQLDAWAHVSLGLDPDEPLPADLVVVRRPVGFWETAPE